MRELLHSYIQAVRLLRHHRRDALDVAEAQGADADTLRIIAAHRKRQIKGVLPRSATRCPD